jgi:hypothetical protein
MHNHASSEIPVQLFVRKVKKIQGKAAPSRFVLTSRQRVARFMMAAVSAKIRVGSQKKASWLWESRRKLEAS